MWHLLALGSSFPTDGWGVIGLMAMAFGGVMAYAGKLISDLRADNKALQDKLIDKAIPALEASAAASQALASSTQRIIDAVLVSEVERGSRKR